MGFFSDKCEALIDPATGRALSGEALTAAKQNPKAPRCGNSVKKAARFCNKCGSGSPGGWWKCPSCAEWVGNESTFCWNCRATLSPESRLDLAGGVWQKASSIFAERFEAGDMKPLLKTGLMVQAGQRAILLDGGKIAGNLGPGRHTVESLGRQINWFNDPPPRSFVMVDDGDVVLPFRVSDIRSSEEIAVEAYFEIAFHLDSGAPEAFLANLFNRYAPRLSYEHLQNELASGVRAAVMDLANTSTIQDLVKDPERRLRLEDSLQSQLKDRLKSLGLELVRVSSVEFTGAEYEKLRAKAGDLEITRRNMEFDQRMRELLTGDTMQQLQEKNRLEVYVNQLAQEKQISKAHRDHEFARLTQVQRHEITREEALFQMEEQNRTLDHQLAQNLKTFQHNLSLAAQEGAHGRTERVADAKVDTEVRKTGFEQEMAEAEAALKLRAQKDKLDADRAQERRKLVEGADTRTLVAMIDDPAQRKDLMDMLAMENTKGRSMMEILALKADKSPAVAEALARLAANDKDAAEKMKNESTQLHRELADRMERMFNKALETTSDAAKNSGPTTNNQIIK